MKALVATVPVAALRHALDPEEVAAVAGRAGLVPLATASEVGVIGVLISAEAALAAAVPRRLADLAHSSLAGLLRLPLAGETGNTQEFTPLTAAMRETCSRPIRGPAPVVDPLPSGPRPDPRPTAVAAPREPGFQEPEATRKAG